MKAGGWWMVDGRWWMVEDREMKGRLLEEGPCSCRWILRPCKRCKPAAEEEEEYTEAAEESEDVGWRREERREDNCEETS